MRDFWSDPDDPVAVVFRRVGDNWPDMMTPQLALAVMVQRLARLAQDMTRDTLAPFGLSVTEFEVLAALRSHPRPHRVMPSQLYDAVLISSGGLTKVLKGLEARPLIERPMAEGDGRLRPIELTAAGRGAVEQAMRAVQAVDAPVFVDPIERADDAERFGQTLARLLGAAEARRGRRTEAPAPE